LPRNGDVESIHRLQQVHCVISRPTCGVVEARSLAGSFDDFQPRFDSKSYPRQRAEKPLFIVPLKPTSRKSQPGGIKKLRKQSGANRHQSSIKFPALLP